MRGFGGHLQKFLRASLQHRVLTGSSPVLCRGSNALTSEAAAGSQLSNNLWRDLPGPDSAVFSFRAFRCSCLLLETVNVEVASFGESITEGSIAGILKQPGQGVETDEVLFQIETDKVAIDVRAPQSGTLEEILVKEDETVTVGQVLARIKAGEAPAKTEGQDAKQEDAGAGAAPAESTALDTETHGDSGAAAEAAKDTASQAEADAEAGADGEAEAAPAPHRTPGIRFPTRRTPEGKRISMLSIEEQKRYKAEARPVEEAPQAAEQEPVDSQKSTVFTPGPWYAGKERGTKLSQSRVLTEREMEMIELGGACD